MRFEGFLYIKDKGDEMLPYPSHRRLLSKTGIFLNINPMRKEGENDGRNRNRTSLEQQKLKREKKKTKLRR